MKLIHITDLHLRTPGETVAGRDPAASLAAAIAQINRNHADADLVVITGDLSDDGSIASYRLLAAAIEGLIPPARLLVGNHDSRAAFASVFGLGDDGFVQGALQLPGSRLLFLDTLDEGAVAGRLCPRRLSWLDAELGRSTEPVLIFMHHPPFDIGMPPLDACKLAAPDAFAALVRRHGKVRHIAAGHVHRLVSGSWNGVTITTGRGTNHQTALLFGATDFAIGTEAPSYNVMLISPADLIVHVEEIE